jgi:putative methionine-R-sulfoxide reductase with GAF domain
MEINGDPVTWSEIVLPLSEDGAAVTRLFLGSYPFQAPPR